VNRIAIIGHFGGKEIFLDGQTVKTKILYDELLKTGEFRIFKVDTYYRKKNPLKLLVLTLWALLTIKKIVVLVSGNGMKFYFPLLAFSAKVRGSLIFHDVIGGNLDKYVMDNPNFKKYLTSFRSNWVETYGMQKKLLKLGVDNCTVIPNFKRLPLVNENDLNAKTSENEIRFCTFSRVMKEKGIESAIETISKINAAGTKKMCFLDIYGAIDCEYEGRFNQILKQYGDCVSYCGCIPFNGCVDVLKNYYCLLFPTYWRGEGFPGTIIDAMCSGLPVIASKWGFNEELITQRKNGLLFDVNKQSEFEDAVLWAISHEDEINEMRRQCVKTALNYSPDKYVPFIKETLLVG